MPLDFRPKLEKIVELLIHLAEVRPGTDKYTAVKLFYLADREHLNRYGRPMSYDRYVAMRYGPVASTVLDLLNGDRRTMREAGLDTLPIETEDLGPTTIIRRPLRDMDRDAVSKSDLRVFDEIIEKFGSKSFNELFELTHDHYAYKRAWHYGRSANAKSALMHYEDMIDDRQRRAHFVEEMGPLSANM